MRVTRRWWPNVLILAILLALIVPVGSGARASQVSGAGGQLSPQEHEGLFAYYPFDRGTAVDVSRYHHHGEVVGATPTEDRFGRPDGALDFSGTGDHVIATGLQDFPAGDVPRSLSGWFRSSDTTAFIMMLFGFGHTQSQENFQLGFGPEGSGSGPTNLRVNGWGNPFDWRTGILGDELLDGAWHHVVVTYADSVTTVYVDGEERASTNDFTYLTNPAQMAFVAGLEIDLDGWDFDGALDDVRIHTRVLHPQEVTRLYRENGWPDRVPERRDDRG